jgi:hypothetical protein
MEYTRMLTYMNVRVEPWNHNNDGGINDIVIDDFDMVPISGNGTPLSRLLFTTQQSRRIPQTTKHIQPRITTIQDHVIDTKVQHEEINGPTKKKLSTRKSSRIRKTPNWMKDYICTTTLEIHSQ